MKHTVYSWCCVLAAAMMQSILSSNETQGEVLEVKEKEKVDNICLSILSLSTVALLCFELEFDYKNENVIIVTDPTAFERMQQKERHKEVEQ